MASFDTIIRNGRIVDGTGAPAFWGDIGISNGRVAAIGRLDHASASEVIDAGGRIVAPGHVTQHAHYDAAIFWDPYLSNSGENGVTTVLNANCGFGFAPLRACDRERTMAMMETTEQIPVAHQRAALTWDWESFPEYLARLEALPKGVNVMTYLPVNPLLVYVMGIDAAKSRAPTEAEMAQMHALINEAMDAGAIGISMSVMGAQGNSHLDADGSPMPTDTMSKETAVALGRAVAARGEGIIQMLSQIAIYGDKSISAAMAEMARGSGAQVIHNIFLTSDLAPQMVDEDLAWLDDLRGRGCDITAGTLAYRLWVECSLRDLDTSAGQLESIRRIARAKNDEEILALIRDPGYIAAFVQEYREVGPANGSGGFEDQTVIDVGSDPALQAYLGKSLGQIAAEEGRDVIEVLLDLGYRSKLALQLHSGQLSSGNPDQALRLLNHPGVSAAVSDGGAHTKTFANGHYGTDLLVWLVREEKRMSLEQMHFQLSLKPAQMLQLRDRGAILPGFWADLIIYDLDELYVDTSRFRIAEDMPEGDWRRIPHAGGYHRVVVNGVTTHIDGVSTGAHPGQLVRTTRSLRSARAA